MRRDFGNNLWKVIRMRGVGPICIIFEQDVIDNTFYNFKENVFYILFESQDGGKKGIAETRKKTKSIILQQYWKKKSISAMSERRTSWQLCVSYFSSINDIYRMALLWQNWLRLISDNYENKTSKIKNSTNQSKKKIVRKKIIYISNVCISIKDQASSTQCFKWEPLVI